MGNCETIGAEGRCLFSTITNLCFGTLCANNCENCNPNVGTECEDSFAPPFGCTVSGTGGAEECLPADPFTTSPSAAPTQAPTQPPSTTPSDSPSQPPTQSPSFSPTSNPTTDPTSNPTPDSPDDTTANPTSNPTNNPVTNSPTGQPTANPTVNPTTPSPTLPCCCSSASESESDSSSVDDTTRRLLSSDSDSDSDSDSASVDEPCDDTCECLDSASASGSDSSSDSSEVVTASPILFAAGNVENDIDHGLDALMGDAMTNGENGSYEMDVSFTKATYSNVWGMVVLFLLLNGLCCFVCYKKKQDKRSNSVNEFEASNLEIVH